jgi:enediyne biosynthesis protein E4
MKRTILTLVTSVIAAILAVGCSPKHEVKAVPSEKVDSVIEPLQPLFTDVTGSAGIHWVHNPCRTGRKLLPETVGGGGGFIDYDNDGKPDIILINGGMLPGYKGTPGRLALYHNNGDGTFQDVTEKSGLDFKGYGFSAVVGDYDNDGWPDLFITALDGCKLYHNDHGHFRDVTAEAGVGVKGFCTAGAWIDYDRDGKLDLFVASYVEWTAETDLPCGSPTARQYCAPNQYKGAAPHLFHNLGGGKFEDVSAKSGVLGHPGKNLGIAVCDFNHDGWPDIFLANDTVANVLLINNKNGTFSDQALTSGVALADQGSATGSMGIDVCTPFSDGRMGVAIGTFATQEASLFVDSGDASGPLLFENKKREVGIADLTHPSTTFGAAFLDANLDGYPDLLLVNGHIDDDPSLRIGNAQVPYRQLPQLFTNMGKGTFVEMGKAAGFTQAIVGRGLAIGDFDSDGKPDLLIFENGGPVRLLHNATKSNGGWLGVRLIGTKSPRDGTGAMVTLVDGAWQQTLCAGTSRSYLSCCDSRLLFGLGSHKPQRLVVKWSSGMETIINTPETGKYITVTEK